MSMSFHKTISFLFAISYKKSNVSEYADEDYREKY